MSVNLTVIEQKFYNQFKNGVDFSQNLTDFTNNLTGSVMEKVKVVQSMDISWGITYAPSQFDWDLSTSGTTLTIVSNDGYNFKEEGFSGGDIIDIGVNVAGLPVVLLNNVVSIVSTNTIIITLNTPYAVPSGIIGIRIEAKSHLTALEYRFGLIENSENFNIISKVSNNDQGYYGENIGFDTGGGVRSTSFVNLLVLGSYSGFVTGSCRARYVSNPDTYTQRFEIEHEFIIVPYYLDGQLTNLQNNITPTLLNGNNSLKYVFTPGLRTVLSNPNTEKTKDFDLNDGSVAWFSERFNGYANNYSISSISYEEASTGANADGILISGTTRVTTVVTGNFSGSEKFGVYVSYLPSQIEYQDTSTNLISNFIYDNAINVSGASSVSGQDFITGCTASIVSGDLVIVFDTDYSTAQQVFLSTNNTIDPVNFIIGIQVGDSNLTSSNSDRVIMIGGLGNYDESPDIDGLVENSEFKFIPYTEDVLIDDGYTDLIQWNEDGFTMKGFFDLNLNQNAFLNNIEINLLAKNQTTNEFFSLDSFVFNTGGAIVSNGVQQLNITSSRNYNLESSSQFNNVSLTTGAQTLGLQRYNFIFSQKVSWQDWILNNNVDSIFYNTSEPNNNLNDKTSNYSFINDYETRIAVKMNVSGDNVLGVSGVTDYLISSAPIRVFDYDLDGNTTPVWSAIIETFDPITNTNLNGAVLNGSDTLFRTTFTNSAGAVTDLTGINAIHRIEETNQNGYNIDELGTLYSYPTSNRLIPKNGLTNLDINLNSGNVITECLVDGTKTSSVDYNISSRIFKEGSILPVSKLEEDGSIKLEEDGSIKIIE